jgi:hypothetical protein
MGEEDAGQGGGVKEGGQAEIPVLDAGVIPKPKIPLPTPTTLKKSTEAQDKRDTKDMLAATDMSNKRGWNTSKLGLRVGADALSAGAAGALVAPIITMIDKAIIENASGRNSLGDSLKQSARELLLRPHRFIGSKPFALIFVRAPTLLLLLHTLLHTLFHIHPTHY